MPRLPPSATLFPYTTLFRSPMRPPGSSPISKGEAYRQYPCMLLDVEVSYGDLISEADDGSHPVPDRESAKDQPWRYCPLVFVFCRGRAVYPMGVTELDFGPEVLETIEL